MNEATWLGVILRAIISLGVLLMGAGLAARVCTGPVAWTIGSIFYGTFFAYVSLGVVPKPNEAGLIYAIQWGAAGAMLYCAGRALGWINPAPAKRTNPEEES